MKKAHILALVPCAVGIGCSHPDDSSKVDPVVALPAQQQIEKIQGDPKLSDEMKQYQIGELKNQPRATP